MEKKANFDVKITIRDDKSGKSYKPMNITLKEKLKVSDKDGKEEIISPQFTFVEGW